MSAAIASRGRVPPSPPLVYIEEGQGPALIFLHGIGGNKSSWTEQLQHFSACGYRCIAWDARGYGESGDYEGEFDFASIRVDLLRLLGHLGLDSAHFVGLSMGGRMLMDFAIEQPARVRSATICGAFPSFDKGLDKDSRSNYLELRQRPLLQGRSFDELAPRLVDSLLSARADKTLRARVHESICALRRDSYLKALRAAAAFDRGDELHRIQAPTLLVYADQDRLTPPDLGNELLGRIPQARLEVLRDSGHLMNMEQPAAFNLILQGFLREVQDTHPEGQS